MNKPIDSQVIVDIIRRRVGERYALTQQSIAEYYYIVTREKVEPRSIRKVIELLRFEGVPILSTPHEPGGYYYPANRQEYFDWKKREMAKAKKQIAKLRPVGFGVYKYFHPNIFQQMFDFGKRLVRVS